MRAWLADRVRRIGIRSLFAGPLLPVRAADRGWHDAGMARRVSSERLIGRAAELATVDALLAGLAPAGQPAPADRPAPPRCLLVGGEAGVGKTRLVRELAGRALARG